jgi:hypothetical protein
LRDDPIVGIEDTVHVATPTRNVSPRQDTPTTARRSGYAIAVGVNIALMMIVNNLLEWGWPQFLTGDFERLLPWINFSLGASVVVNLLYMAYDADWFKSGWQVVLTAISLAVLIRTYQLFPFDFSDFSWPAETIIRIVLWVVGGAMVIAIAAEGLKSITSLARRAVN